MGCGQQCRFDLEVHAPLFCRAKRECLLKTEHTKQPVLSIRATSIRTVQTLPVQSRAAACRNLAKSNRPSNHPMVLLPDSFYGDCPRHTRPFRMQIQLACAIEIARPMNLVSTCSLPIRLSEAVLNCWTAPVPNERFVAPSIRELEKELRESKPPWLARVERI